MQRISSGFVEQGVKVSVAGFGPHRLGSEEPIDLGDTPSAAPSERLLAVAIPRLARAIRAVRPDIVNAHYVSSYGLMAALAVRLAQPLSRQVRLVQTAWGTDLLVTARESATRRAIASLALREAALITGDSLDLAAAARELAPNVPFHRFIFGPPESLLSAARRSERRIISSRRLDPDTRIEAIVEAFDLAKASQPVKTDGWRLTVAGDGIRRDLIEELCEKTRDVDFVGSLRTAELHELLLRSDIFVSVPVSDATSAALLEAIAAGVQPVVNDLPANREWVDPTIGVVTSRDPSRDELANGLLLATQRSIETGELRNRVADVTWEREIASLVSRLGSV